MKNLYLPLIRKGSRYLNTSRRSAELIKYASNAFLATKISFIKGEKLKIYLLLLSFN